MKLTVTVMLSLCAMGNQVCEQFRTDHVVGPPRLRGSIFTTFAVDNIDYNSSSTTSKESFHGTGISLFQHLKFDHEGVERNITALKQLINCHTTTPLHQSASSY